MRQRLLAQVPKFHRRARRLLATDSDLTWGQFLADGRFGEEFSGAGFTQYLAGMALQAAARLPGAETAWREAAARAERHLPTGSQMAKLNGSLAHPETFPERWADAGGPVTLAALEMLRR